jgi:hypothetical protein
MVTKAFFKVFLTIAIETASSDSNDPGYDMMQVAERIYSGLM